jgi:tetratricopeptide (TPR) repeat protein
VSLEACGWVRYPEAAENLASMPRRLPNARSVTLVWLAAAALSVSAPGQQGSPLREARALFAAGQYAKAESLLRPLVIAEPGNADAHVVLGECLAMQNQRSAAIDELTAAARLEPDSAAVYNTLGTVLERFLETDAARQAFTRAISLDPNLAEAHVSLALLLAQSGNLPGAAEHLDTAIHLQGNHASVAVPRYLRGKLAVQQNDYPKAISELQAAVAVRPAYQQAWLMLGIARRASLDDAGALIAFRRAAELDPRDFHAQYELGSEFLSQGKPRDAVVYLKKARVLTPDDWGTLYKLERAARQEHDAAAASEYEAQLRQLVHQNDQTGQRSLEAQQQDNEGVELEKQGDLRGALEKYRAASELVPDEDGYRLNFALALCRLNRWDQGISEMRDIVRRDPNNADAQKALFIAQDKAKRAGIQ